MQSVLPRNLKTEQEKPILLYHGGFSENLFDCILELAETKLKSIEYKSATRKKIFHIIIELIQNVFNYYKNSSLNGSLEKQLIFAVLKENNGYSILSGNHMKNDQVEYVKSRLDKVNAMTSEELRSQYRKRLNEGIQLSKEGAGLGIIDILRRSRNRLEYDVKQVDATSSLFFIKVYVQKKNSQ